MKTVFLFIPSRMYVSDLLHTPYIAELAERYRVIVFLPAGDSAQNADTGGYFQHANVTYRILPDPKGKFWTLFDSLLRNELIRRYEDNTAVQWRNDMTRDNRRLLLRRFARRTPRNLFQTDFFSLLERYTVPDFPLFKAYARRYSPDAVLVSTPGVLPFDAYAILCARRMRIPSVAIDFSWDNLTSLPRLVRRADYLVCWNNFQKRAAQKLHDYSGDRLFVSGAIRFDHYFRKLDGEAPRSVFLKERGLDPSRKTVLYAARSYGSYYKEFIRAFIRWQSNCSFKEPLNLFVRVHPLDPASDYEEFMNVPNVYIGLAGTEKSNTVGSGKYSVETQAHDWTVKKDTVRHSDICVNLASTFSLEAFIFNKPVINMKYARPFSGILTFPHYQPLLDARSVRLAESVEDIRNHINAYLTDPTLDEEGRACIVKEFVAPTDGFSHRRNIGFLDEIMELEYGNRVSRGIQ